MGKKLTTEEFINKANIVHSTKYDYSKTSYLNNRTKVTIICPTHGEFEQKASSHLSGCGCPACANLSISSANKQLKEDFVSTAKEIHGDKYDYSDTVYVNMRTHLKIKCTICKTVFTKYPPKHTTCKQGCPVCVSKEAGMKLRYTIQEFTDKARNVHGNKYSYVNSVYSGAHKNITIVCPIHGEFEQQPANHLQGQGCPSCAEYGFDPSKPAILYTFKISSFSGEVLYKIGITNRSVSARYNNTDLKRISDIVTISYDTGYEALEKENYLKQKYKEYLYKGETPFTNKTLVSEVFVINIFEFDKAG